MPSAVDRTKRAVSRVRVAALARLRAARAASPAFDHLVRTYQRYTDVDGNRLAGGVTFFGFLSFFPLMALAFAVVGYLARVYPGVRELWQQTIDQLLPGLSGSLKLGDLHPKSTGVIGLIALLFTGVGWISALRDALRAVWLHRRGGGNFVKVKLGAVLVMAVLGIGLLASVGVSSLATSATRGLLSSLGLEDVFGAGVALRVLSIAVAVLFDTGIYLVMFSKLAASEQPWRSLLRGALLGAVGFEVLKLLGTYLVGHTTSNPVYGAFAVVVGLLVWLNVVARFTLLAAAWTATSLPVPPPLPDMVPIPATAEPDQVSAVPAAASLRSPVSRRAGRTAYVGTALVGTALTLFGGLGYLLGRRSATRSVTRRRRRRR